MTMGCCSAGGVGTGIGSPPQTIRHRSAMMNEMPSVTSTWPSAFPASARRIRRSTSPPNTAMMTPPMIAASQRLGTYFRTEIPTYAPSMYKEPCVRFAMRISPKMSEKPAASRNSRPPRARLFSVWMIQYCTKNGAGCPGPVFLPCLRLEILRGRPVARVHRILQELLRLVGPELAHVRVGVDDAVHEAPVLALDLADIHAPDHVAVAIEGHRSPRGVDLDGAHGLHERGLVLDVAFQRLQGRFEHRGFDVGRGGIEPRVVAPVDAEVRDEALVDRILDLRRVPAGGDDTEGLVTHVAQHRFVERSHAADDRDLASEAVLVELPEEAEAVRARETEEDAVNVGLELGDIGPVVGNCERREQLLHDLAARVLEHALEAGAHLVPIGDVVGDRQHALVLERLGAVVGERLSALRRSRGAASEPRIGLALRHVLGGR